MPRLSVCGAAVAVVLAGAGSARAQLAIPTARGQGSPGLNSLPAVGAAPGQQQMPGTNVGKPLLQNVGTVFPKAVSPAGAAVGTAPGKVPQTSPSATLPGGNINYGAVVGPLPRGTIAPGEQTLWDKVVDRFGDTLGITSAEPRSPAWTPGIARRNRDRDKEKFAQWRRD